MRKKQIGDCTLYLGKMEEIRSRDTADTFFYCDPPYVGSDQGHYDGYTQEDFDGLLNLLADVKRKFLLSSFRNETLDKFVKKKRLAYF